MKYELITVFFFLFLNIVKSIDLETINSNTSQIILIKNEIVYTTEEDSKINIISLDDGNTKTIDGSGITRKKHLINLFDEEFILFGYKDNLNDLLFEIYNINDNSLNNSGKYELNIYFNTFDIKLIDENKYLLYTFLSGSFYIYKIDLNSLNPDDRFVKEIDLYLDVYNIFNIIECDSFDSINYFCIYSLITNDQINDFESIIIYYSFYNDNNEQIKSIAIEPALAASLTKITIKNKNKFILCHTDKENIYCKYFIQQDDKIHMEETHTIKIYNNYYMGQINYQISNPMKIVLSYF